MKLNKNIVKKINKIRIHTVDLVVFLGVDTVGFPSPAFRRITRIAII